MALLALLVLVAVVTLANAGAGGPSRPAPVAARPAKIPAAEAGLLPWRLPAPISREVILPGSGNQLTIVGGLNGSTSASGVFALDTTNGNLQQTGTLAAGVHDSAGALIGGQATLFGGGSPATVATVQALSVGAGSPSKGSVVGALPTPRSDAASVSIGGTTLVVGGYDGSKPDPAVLATTDGRSYRSIGSLKVPVRYPAVAAVGGKLYVFGGDAITGVQAGRPVDDIQTLDLATHTARVVGHLPEPLAAAAAVSLGGHIYLAGGESTTPQQSVTGVGTTQLEQAPPSGPKGGVSTVSTIWAFDPRHDQALVAGRLQVPVSHAGAAVLGSRVWLVGGESGGAQLTTVQMFTPLALFGIAGAPGAGSPYYRDKLLIADRANNRLLVMDASMNILWKFPSAASGPDPYGFYFPDDAFFINHGTGIISNQEQNETIQQIGFPSGKILWVYGHRLKTGSAPGYLHEPDDAYLLKTGQVSIADAQNCRVLILNPDKSIAHQIGATGGCTHNPPTSLGAVNGDTPLANGNILISETTGSWVSEYTPAGHLVWDVHLPIGYPSDPQQLGPDLYLLADYVTPGQILKFNRAGQILYRYDVASGPGMLNQPSLAEILPSGVIMVNDDYRHRVVAIDPVTKALVWQYGTNDRPGTAPGMLNIPDGFDILTPNGTTPTHLATR